MIRKKVCYICKKGFINYEDEKKKTKVKLELLTDYDMFAMPIQVMIRNYQDQDHTL